MWTVRLRTLVASIGLIVTLGVSLSIPCGFFYLRYTSTSHELTYKSELAASRVAKYVYLHQALWQYQAIRIAEMIELTGADGDNYALSVHNETGAVIASAGPALLTPTMVRSFPIRISGAAIGRVDAARSLRPLFWETAFVALLSFIFGIGVYFAVRVFPLRVLDRTVAELEAAKQTIQDNNKILQVQNERFDAALTNMSQGLLMFDANGKIVIFNQRVAEIYGLPIELIKPGMTTPELMSVAFSQGKVADVDPEGTLALRQNIAHEGKAGSMIERLTDGRSITLSYRPMPRGASLLLSRISPTDYSPRKKSGTWRISMRSPTCRTG